MDLALEDLGCVGKIFFFEPEGEPELFCQVGMSLLLVKLVSIIIEHILVVRVFNHAERERFENRLVMQIMLDGPSLQSPDRKLSIAQLGEIATLHETLYTGLDDFFNHRLNDCFAIHKLAPSSLFSGQYLIEQCIVFDCRYMNRSRNLLEAIG